MTSPWASPRARRAEDVAPYHVVRGRGRRPRRPAPGRLGSLSAPLCYNCRMLSPPIRRALGPDPPPPVPSTGGVSVSFSAKAVVFEDRHETAPGAWAERRSTRTVLAVRADGGPDGGTFTLTPRNIGKLAPEGGTGPLSLPSGGTLAPGETYSATFECSGVEASGAEGDVAVSASFTDAGSGETQGDEAKLTVVRVEIRSTVDPPDPSARSINRHTYGVCERIELLQFPGSPKVAWEPVGGGTLDSESFYSCPLSGCRNPLLASCASISYTPQIEVVEPDGIKAELLYGTTRESVITYGVPRGKAGGIGMWLRLSVKPFHVSFSRIAVQEVVSFTYDASGYFSNPYFNGAFAHTGGIGGAGAGIWHDIDEDNYFSDDEAAYNAVVPWLTQKGIPTNDPACSWTSGYVYMDNPFGWNKKGTSGDETVYKRFAEDVQDEIMIDAVGTVGVRKLFNQVTRTTNDVIHVNGRRIQ